MDNINSFGIVQPGQASRPNKRNLLLCYLTHVSFAIAKAAASPPLSFKQWECCRSMLPKYCQHMLDSFLPPPPRMIITWYLAVELSHAAVMPAVAGTDECDCVLGWVDNAVHVLMPAESHMPRLKSEITILRVGWPIS